MTHARTDWAGLGTIALAAIAITGWRYGDRLPPKLRLMAQWLTLVIAVPLLCAVS